MSLKDYERKRNFGKTPEPPADAEDRPLPDLRFVVHKHAATRLHYDLRLEMDGAYTSWALPQGIPLNPVDRFLAVHVENHPLAYGNFEGIIPKGNYGAGTLMLWDYGLMRDRTVAEKNAAIPKLLAGLAEGKMAFFLHGQKLKGEFALIRLKDDPKNWLILKKNDSYCIYGNSDQIPGWEDSALTGRSLEDIAGSSAADGAIWTPGDGPGPRLQQALPLPPWQQLRFAVTPKSKTLPLPELAADQFGEQPQPDPHKKLAAKETLMDTLRGYSYTAHPDWRVEAAITGLRTVVTLQSANGKARVKLQNKTGKTLTDTWQNLISELKSSQWPAATIRLDCELGTFTKDGNWQGVRRPEKQTAMVTVQYCEDKKIPYRIKTSGSKGIHIGIPVAGGDFDQAREFAYGICQFVEAHLPHKTTTERVPEKRSGKLYLDYMQNRRGQTLASVYCVRPRPGAPVSTPITKAELETDLTPQDFHLGNITKRLAEVGDLWLHSLRENPFPIGS